MTHVAESPAPAAIGVVPRGTPAPAGIKNLHVLLIKPSKYDDDGYVMRYFRGVLPSNTLATLAALTEEVDQRKDLGNVRIEVTLIDEHVQKIAVSRLVKRLQRPGTVLVVALCGVQTNQFPRGADLARRFRAEGVPVLLGGFHVSGAIAMSVDGIPPECQALIDDGITLVKGEVEECWGDLLRDALHGRLQGYYDIISPPDLSRANVPVVDSRLMKRFAYPYMGTIDAGRGCPFSCSFCTIINVQGRKMRCRLAESIKQRVRDNSHRGIKYYFFTDDNFSRNPNWEEIFDALIDLRKTEGIPVHFMMQVDTLAYKLPNFLAKAVEAGCCQVFIGMETLNPANIPAAGKNQNRVGDYSNMIAAWHAHQIVCHVGYIIGFPFDTVESVREDVRRLRDEIKVDQASFFMLTPLPGSEDHHRMKVRGEWMDVDYNRFDSFHATTRHPRMSSEEWSASYREAWREFYGVDSMKAILARADKESYWGIFKNFVWYRHSAIIDDTHPMICGFFRLKDRTDRRPGYAVEPVWKHYWKRAGEVARWGREIVRFYFDMQEVWLATRGREDFRGNIASLKQSYANMRERLGDSATRAGQALNRGVASVRAASGDALNRSVASVKAASGDALNRSVASVKAASGEALQRAGTIGRQAADEMALQFQSIRGRVARTIFWRRVASSINPFAVKIRTRAHLNAYWRGIRERLTRGEFFRINPFLLGWNLVRDARLCLLFNISLITSYGK